MMSKGCMACLILLLLLAGVDGGFCANSDLPPEVRRGAEAKQKLIREAIRADDVPFSFFGKVVDQFGQPVEGAQVEIHIQQFSPYPEALFGKTKHVFAQTSKGGRFSVVGEHGMDIYIKDITNEGYDSMHLLSQQRNFGRCANPPIPMPTKDAPAIFVLRKKGETVFLLEGEGSLDLESNDTFSSKSLMRPRDADFDAFGEGVASAWPGIAVKGKISGNPRIWTVTLAGRCPGDGVLSTSTRLYEAPADGYQSRITITASAEQPLADKEALVYLKTSSPETYSAISLRILPWPDKCKVVFKSLTNPYGTRNLEPDTEIASYWKLNNHIKRTARAALSQHKRPEKLDLPKLIKEEKKKSESEKTEREKEK